MTTAIKRFFGRSKRIQLLYFYLGFILQILMNNLLQPKRLWLFFSVLPYTMVGYSRIENAYTLALKVSSEGLKGSFVECGV